MKIHFEFSRVSSAEVSRSVERLLPELIAKSGDATPRIHNMAAHTLLSMADCKEVRCVDYTKSSVFIANFFFLFLVLKMDY